MPVQIRNKSYYTVAERLQAVYESGKAFEMVESVSVQVGDRFAWRCTVVVDGKTYIGNAVIHYDAPKGSADSTDPFACAETSALGRALAFAGFAVDGSIASADEMRYAVEPEQPVTRDEALHNLARPQPAQPTTVKNTLHNSPPSPNQLEEIGRLAKLLGRQVHRPATYSDANELHLKLSREYNAAQAAQAS